MMSDVNLAPGNKVSIGKLQHRPEKTNPWIVRWKVKDKWHSRSFRNLTLADDYRSRLLIARNDLQRFNRDSGLPPGFRETVSALTFAVYAHQLFTTYHAQSSPKTRRANAQSYAMVIPLVVPNSHKGTAPTDIRPKIQAWLAGEATIPRWVEDNSLPLSEITSDTCREVERDIKLLRVKDREASKNAGHHIDKPVAPRDVQRYIGAANAILNDAVNTKVLAANPWVKDNSQRRFKQDRINITKTIHRDTLPSIQTCEAFMRFLQNDHPGSAGYQVLAQTLFFLGLRPSEALALSVDNLKLPDTGWGEALVDVSLTDAGSRWTSSTETYGLTKTGTSRRVPIPPDLVTILSDWVGDRTSGLLVETRSGTPVSATNLARAFRTASQHMSEARESVGQPAVKITPYTLRHVCATVMLGAGVSLGEAARRLGHSPMVLMKTYLGVLGDDEVSANQRLEAAFKSK